jgi:hypothetical protein
MRTLTANTTEEGEMKRLIWLAVLLAGCARGPYPRLAGGERAILFDRYATVIRVETDPGKGIGGDNWQLIDVGTPVLVLADESEDAGEDRMVHAKAMEGEHQGLHFKAKRRYLKIE